MKKFLMTMLLTICCTLGMMAQADKIVGTYKAVHDGKESKVKIFKYQNGYRAQVCWLKETKNPDGSVKKDVKNPDKAKRNTPADQIVLVDKVTYEDGIWQNGKIYEPTSGKTYKVEIKFTDAKTLQVRGKLGPFFKNVYWTKL